MELCYLKYNFVGYVILGNYGICLIYINGCFYKFEIISDFKDIVIGSFFKFEFVVDYWFVVWIDVMLRWYVIVKGLSLWVIKNMDDKSFKFVGNFDIREKWKCFVVDFYNFYIFKKCYDKYYIVDNYDSVYV